jgi:hypothetical protein
VPVAYPASRRFHGSEEFQRTDRLGELLHEYRIAA